MVAFGMKMKEAQGGFFDRPGVLRIIDAGTAAGLSKFGAYVRQTAQQSIRSPGKKGKPSKPGRPPKNRTGKLKDNIFFTYDQTRRSVVIGPISFNGGGGKAPAVLEYGGTFVRNLRFKGGRSKSVTVQIAARPYMTPAFEKNLKKLPRIWKDIYKP